MRGDRLSDTVNAPARAVIEAPANIGKSQLEKNKEIKELFIPYPALCLYLSSLAA